MDPLSTTDSATDFLPPVVKATTSSSSMEVFDSAIIAGVISAVLITLLIVLVLVAIYLYKHKGSYRTHETIEEGEAKTALQERRESGEEKQEYFM